MEKHLTRRKFLAQTTAVGIGLTLPRAKGATVEKPALLGGKPSRTAAIPSWPIFDQSEEQALLETLRSKKWFRGSGKNVNNFETAFGELFGAKFCVGTSSGTNALISSLNALGVGAGDEVILPPYTFVACVNAILMLGALPVFVDTDRETFQIDARKIEATITERTAAIMPVHLGGNAADLDTILALARKHNLPVVEDACQAHLGEWRNRKLGTFGQTGCFSFQASKNLTAGEGGMIVTDDEELAEKCFASHNNSRPRKAVGPHPNLIRGSNLRMSEFHASILLAQMKRLPEQARRRDENGAYLNKMLVEIPGIIPARAYDGATRNAFHLYMFRYQKEKFANLPRAKFLAALSAEGVPASPGYQPLNQEPFIARTVRSPKFQRAFSERRIADWTERNTCPENNTLCEEAVWFTQNFLLAERAAMEQIVEAIQKIQRNAAALARP
jgi:dTDP-4-amino-4,6-dideoxygalactose transaminase